MVNAGSPAALACHGLGKTFSSGSRVIQALDGIDLTVTPGRITGLIGPDGAGKTTLMRLAAGLLRADAGELRVLDLDVSREPLAVQSVIGYMPQRFGLYEDLSVQENLDLYADLQGVLAVERRGRYAELLHMVGLARFTARLAGRLSGGMKQKLGLACTLVRPPRLLLLDEPTVGVDPVSRRELWAIVQRLVREEGVSVLLSTAYLDEAERCDEVILLHQGRLLGQGTPASFSEPLTGRCYLVNAPTIPKRRLQMRLTALPAVADAIIQGESVRVVARAVGPLDLSSLDAGPAGVEIRPVVPNFEDAFIIRLQGEHDATTEESPPLPMAATMANDDAAVIRVDRVQRRFGEFYAVKDVSFEVRRGEIFGLLGANGAGKSTTFRMLCGLLPASGGQLEVAGHDLRHAAAQARGRIGYMAQRFSLYGNLTVAQNLRFFASAYGLTGQRRRERIRWALDGFDLERYADMASGDLPLGYKQRLAMAAALMHEPDILFLDEPTSGVDPLARREFWHRINLLAEQGVTVLVTTHFMDEANYCDRLVIMADGEVLAQGTPAETKARFRDAERSDPTMEDAFIALIEQRAQTAGEPA
ncbi:ABC transporter ATP-binding protein [Candidatus Competibacter phosphatis]|uniref:ABC transporter ATP-binding protein n=1 Tax=Candidatus Competibacter phosphatis TaxID=221280 RepID=A0ABX1TJL6_9GAMM|nr:ATP-binding cassette domain-containing protein [Candidatus Competibacter phosphatis]NMQ19567.1 ABC transporter ATP-binding protein [Candidatus Competibacter phosphatis]